MTGKASTTDEGDVRGPSEAPPWYGVPLSDRVDASARSVSPRTVKRFRPTREGEAPFTGGQR
jgi:hypothetical protein